MKKKRKGNHKYGKKLKRRITNKKIAEQKIYIKK